MSNELSQLTVDDLFLLGGVEVYDGRHFIYSGGDHGPGYANFRPLGDPDKKDILSELSYRLIMKAIEGAKLDVSRPIAVIGPETLGAKIAASGVAAYNSRRSSGLPPLRSGHFIHDPKDKSKFL